MPIEMMAQTPGRASAACRSARSRLTARGYSTRRPTGIAAYGLNMGVAGIGEFDLIARLVESVEAARRERSASWGPQVRLGSGDDAAITVPPGATATSVDAMVEGVHFRRDTAPLSSVGRKALATALSDLAAMGAVPGRGLRSARRPGRSRRSGLRRAGARARGGCSGPLRGGARR